MERTVCPWREELFVLSRADRSTDYALWCSDEKEAKQIDTMTDRQTDRHPAIR